MNDSSTMTKSLLVNGNVFVPFITAEEINARVSEIAQQLDRDFQGKKPIFICILNGAFIFFADLLRMITIDCEVDFLKLSSYGEKNISSGNVQLLKDLDCEVRDRHIVIVEDIVDTGYSIDFMKNWILKSQPATLSVVTLLYKPDQEKIHHILDYVGFTIPPRFVIGYGLDYAQQARNLPEIYIQAETNGSDFEV